MNSVALSADGQRCLFGTSNEYGTGQFAVYCYNGDGTQRWKSPIGAAGATQGVFWVALSADGKVAAAGGKTATDVGFLTAYRSDDGSELLKLTALPNRVNQVALSADGGLLLAVFQNSVQLYRLGLEGYALVSSQDLAPLACGSCGMSEDGTMAVVGGIVYSDGDKSGASYTPNTGQVAAFRIKDDQLAPLGTWDAPSEVLRVAMTAGGAHWGAGLSDGSCALFNGAQAATPLWTYNPDPATVSYAYGFDITETGAGRVILACGATVAEPVPAPTPPAPNGVAYAVESVMRDGKAAAKLLWRAPLQYTGNPGICLDREARYVTATDGKPLKTPPGQPVAETPGNFYLFDVTSGAALWTYPTKLMNWPMVITPDGSHVFGGSDTGSVYYWNQSTR